MLEAIAVAEDASVEVVTSPHPPAIKKMQIEVTVVLGIAGTNIRMAVLKLDVHTSRCEIYR